jgi:hypothetical protein
MNRIIETNASELLDNIVEQARITASQTTPVAKVSMSMASGCMIGELLDIDPIESNGGIVLNVADSATVEAQVEALRADATPVLKRVITKFKTSLNEAKVRAQADHIDVIASANRRLISGGNNLPILGRPLSSYNLDYLVEAHGFMVNFLLNQTTTVRIAYGHDEGDEFMTTFDALNDRITVSTKSRYKIVDGQITHRYRHNIQVSNSNTNWVYIVGQLRNHFKNQDSVSVARHNKTLNGAIRHFEKFALLVIDAIETELVARTNDLAAVGLHLTLTREAVDYTPTEEVTSTEVAQAFEAVAEPVLETTNV